MHRFNFKTKRYTLWKKAKPGGWWGKVEESDDLDYLKALMESLPRWEHREYQYQIRDNYFLNTPNIYR